MVVLSDSDIHEAIRTKQLMIKPLRPERIQNNSYKLSLNDTVTFKKHEFKNLWTKERIELSENMVGLLTARSYWARRGLFFCASIGVDAGFKGNLIIEIFNASDETITVPADEPFMHLWLIKTSSRCTPYGGVFLNQKPGDKVHENKNK